MSMKKRLLALACTFALTAGFVGALPEGFDGLGVSLGVSAEDLIFGEYGDYNYKVLDDETVEITWYYGTDAEVDIPLEIDGKKVTSIGLGCFYLCQGLTSITIPDSVTFIGNEAFCGCTSLTSIIIPDSVTNIGAKAFSFCTGLTSITIPDSVTSIDMAVFAYCRSLTSINIPDSVINIGEAAFADCTSLASITIPASVTSIGNKAFGFFYDEENNQTKVDGFKIYCYKGTAGHQYALDNEFVYTLLDAVPGDANGDGKTNMKDLVLVQRHLNGWNVDIDLTVCDLTGDGKVNMKDYVALQRQLNGWTA